MSFRIKSRLHHNRISHSLAADTKKSSRFGLKSALREREREEVHQAKISLFKLYCLSFARACITWRFNMIQI